MDRALLKSNSMLGGEEGIATSMEEVGLNGERVAEFWVYNGE